MTRSPAGCSKPRRGGPDRFALRGGARVGHDQGRSPYRAFTPFARARRDHGWPGPAPRPDAIPWRRVAGDRLAEPPDVGDLVDAGLASNQHGWQWTAGTGTDPAPFFRISNPATQGERFDPDGTYVRRWVPELAGAPRKWIHRPHDSPEGPPGGYRPPVVDHAGGAIRVAAEV